MSDNQPKTAIAQRQHSSPGSSWSWWYLGLGLAAFTALVPTLNSSPKGLCPQASMKNAPLQDQMTMNIVKNLTSEWYREKSIRRLAGAVQIQTVTYDDMGPVDRDPRWKVFDDFADYLQATFPMVHSRLKLEKVNTHGLLYTWSGSVSVLKPTVLMAHQDVVPVPDDTVPQWSHAPFSGEFDGSSVWGRGSLDCKNTLLASLEAIEALLEAEFEPRRTIILSFGFDEEISGHHGAAFLASHLLRRYGENGVSVIIDEGAPILPIWGTHIAIPGVSEKGYVDVEIVVRTKGGHSSMPPLHTSAGIAAELVNIIERSPYAPQLHEQNPLVDLLWCGAEHAPRFVPGLKYLIPRRGNTGVFETMKRLLLPRLVSRVNHMAAYLISTTQAVGVVRGGVKVNALPEQTTVLINHRVNVGETSELIRKKLTKLGGVIAKRHNLTLNAFHDSQQQDSSIRIGFMGSVLEPAPITPTQASDEEKDTPWSVLSSTTKDVYGKKVIMAPGINPGNTDTRYYWKLSRHIFRYSPTWDPEVLSIEGIHTVNERASIAAHVKTVEWYLQFLKNMDHAELR
ncbi:carboxypeptidase s [Fusarium longipes]|uniref:Carboxypeptidase s n=1 Tax=Fusarium longipes TaxID=694270 RepID=A0A395T942_9HYPO|nr:carboxypeptidase s [Fusarium longipes]